jgi:hypothetical protein
MPHQTAEHWQIDVGDTDVATLNIPPALARARRFHVDVRFVVQCPAAGVPAWHALTVEINTSNPGQTDSLDYHCRVEAPAGAGVRVRALTKVQGAMRRRLWIEASEA